MTQPLPTSGLSRRAFAGTSLAGLTPRRRVAGCWIARGPAGSGRRGLPPGLAPPQGRRGGRRRRDLRPRRRRQDRSTRTQRAAARGAGPRRGPGAQPPPEGTRHPPRGDRVGRRVHRPHPDPHRGPGPPHEGADVRGVQHRELGLRLLDHRPPGVPRHRAAGPDDPPRRGEAAPADRHLRLGDRGRRAVDPPPGRGVGRDDAGRVYPPQRREPGRRQPDPA